MQKGNYQCLTLTVYALFSSQLNRKTKKNYQCLTLTVYALFPSQLNRKTQKTFKTDGGHTDSRTAQEAK